MDKVYISYKLSSKVIDRKQKWFYVGNHNTALLEITPGPPTVRPEWNMGPVDDSQIQDLLKWIEDLKKEKMSRAAVVMDWMKRRIQSLQYRVKPGFEYLGTSDPSRYSIAEISEKDALHQVQRVLDAVDKALYVHLPGINRPSHLLPSAHARPKPRTGDLPIIDDFTDSDSDKETGHADTEGTT
jgi:hypothetical protein